jgi:TolA-binding protein
MFPEGQRIVFTGKLASMSRREAIARVVARGGIVNTKVSRRSDIVVIGSDGWPLRKTGKLTRHLETAEKLDGLGFPIDVIPEQEFLRRLHSDRVNTVVCRTHTLEQLSRLLGISGLRLRRWIDRGLIEPIEFQDGVALFDFQQINAARTVADLIRRGVPIPLLVSNLRRLQRWIPEDAVVVKCIVQLQRNLVVRDASGFLVEPNGQLRLPLEDMPENELPLNELTLNIEQTIEADPDALFDHAFNLEKAGQLPAAITAYERWISLYGDDVEALFNLGNCYLATEQHGRANDCYLRCLKLDDSHGPAWNNHGLCLAELGQTDQARKALSCAIQLMPQCNDTKANLVSITES